MTNCERCNGETKSGSRCSRLASCKLGCKLYCYQHSDVKLHIKGKQCVDGKPNAQAMRSDVKKLEEFVGDYKVKEEYVESKYNFKPREERRAHNKQKRLSKLARRSSLPPALEEMLNQAPHSDNSDDQECLYIVPENECISSKSTCGGLMKKYNPSNIMKGGCYLDENSKKCMVQKSYRGLL
jgi:hypothetical protein